MKNNVLSYFWCQCIRHKRTIFIEDRIDLIMNDVTQKIENVTCSDQLTFFSLIQ